MNPFLLSPQKITKAFTSWKGVFIDSYDKETVDPYTRVRMILLNGTEFESNVFYHQFNRHCTNNDVRREISLIRRQEQFQQKRIASLKPRNENILEQTIGYEQLAVDLTAILARREKNREVKAQLDFALLEDFDHLYRFSDLMELEKKGDPQKLVGTYTEVMPGRPTISEQRHPFDDVKNHINCYLSDPLTKLNVSIITAAEQQTMNYYMNVANLYESDLGRKIFGEIAMIEEQHVTGYGSLKDPSCTWLECALMNEYTECYLYYSAYKDEKDERIRSVYAMHFEQEVSHLHQIASLLKKYEGKEWQQVFVDGGEFPELLQFKPQKEYVREVLKSVNLTAVSEGFQDISEVPASFRFFSYNNTVEGITGSIVPTHRVIEKTIKKFGKDYRIQDKNHPVKLLSSREEDNVTVGRRG